MLPRYFRRTVIERFALIHSIKPFLCAAGACALALLGEQGAQAQPANDNFANAWLLSGAVVTTNGTTAGASKETGEPNHAGNIGGRSIWFNWIAPRSGQIRIDTIGSASGFNGSDTLLAVYT